MPSISLRNLSVEFPIYRGGSRSLKKALIAASSKGNLSRDAQERVTVRALSDLNLDVADGDRLGILGANGAGKTTLLKILAGVYEPSHGRVFVSGNATALLDTSVGMDLDATGRENIILRGMYMDVHPRQMRPHVERIVEFTELGSYLDMPVRSYSAGMKIRLAFAISTSIQPEILIMDEWLAAGDAHFLAKAQKHLEDFVANSSIVILASHSMPLLRQWCNRGLLLVQGQAAAFGHINDVIDAYIAHEANGAR